jgi:Skp family chaperone for outer membrane proteins
MGGMRQVIWAGAFVLLALTGPTAAQNAITRSPVLVIDTDALFARSQLGQRFQAEIDRRVRALEAENATIEAALQEEERALADQRTTMSAEEFRPLADAFDEKAQRIRQEQDAKELAIRRLPESLRREFLTAANPVLAQIMLERGAAVIIDQRSVFRFAEAVDVTEAVIAALNQQDTFAE